MVIGFIGAGNISESIIGGLVLSKSINSQDILVSNYNKIKSEKLVEQYNVKSASNLDIIKEADIIILGVKPYLIEKILLEIKDNFTSRAKYDDTNDNYKHNKELIVVSLAAGITLETMEDITNSIYSYEGGVLTKVVRAMPNTSCKVLSGIFAVTFGNNFSNENKETIRNLFSPLGTFLEVEEHKMGAISALAGCAPAFIYEAINALSDGGVQMGLSRAEALELAATVVQGAGKMVRDTNIHPSLLKEQITSPAGSTIEGIYSLEKAGFRGTLMKALQASFNKNRN